MFSFIFHISIICHNLSTFFEHYNEFRIQAEESIAIEIGLLIT